MKNAHLYYVLLLALQLFTPVATAMTQNDAANNIMHIAFAIKEGEFCERLGYPGEALLKRWKEEHGTTLVTSLRAIEAYAETTRTVTSEQAKAVAIGFTTEWKIGSTLRWHRVSEKNPAPDLVNRSETTHHYWSKTERQRLPW